MSELSFTKIKYESSMVTFTEVPDEISLCFNITGCPCHCIGCFEPWLAEDTGTILDYAVLKAQIDAHPHITCICFMGGDRYPFDINYLINQARKEYPELKFAMYSGMTKMHPQLSQVLDYYKIGPYIENYGPLNKKTTNQCFYKKVNNNWINMTERFQKEKI